MVRTITAAAALTIAGSAMAIPTGAHWVQVDNSVNIAGTGSQAFADAWCTFDLFLSYEAGDVGAAFDFGIAGANIGVSTDGTVFDGNTFSTDSVAGNIGFAGLVGNLEYDSAVTVNGGTVAFVDVVGEINFNPAGFTGAWFVNPAQAPSDGLDMWVARITVSSDATFLGGQMFVSGTGPNGAFGQGGDNLLLGVVNIPNAKIPTPGALALFGLAGAAAIRRRR